MKFFILTFSKNFIIRLKNHLRFFTLCLGLLKIYCTLLFYKKFRFLGPSYKRTCWRIIKIYLIHLFKFHLLLICYIVIRLQRPKLNPYRRNHCINSKSWKFVVFSQKFQLIKSIEIKWYESRLYCISVLPFNLEDLWLLLQ